MLGGSVGGAAGAESFGWSISRAGALRGRGDRAARRRRAASDVRRRRARDGARDRARRSSSRCATTCIAIRCGSRRRRRSPDIRTACRRGRRGVAADDHGGRRCARGTARACSTAPAVIAHRRRRGSGRARRARGARVRRAARRRARSARSRRRGRRAWCSAMEQREKAQTAMALLFPGPSRARRRALRGGDDRRRRERTRRPLLRRAARQAVARLHGARVQRRARARRHVRRVHRDVAGEGGGRARADCSPSSRSCATSR